MVNNYLEKKNIGRRTNKNIPRMNVMALQPPRFFSGESFRFLEFSTPSISGEDHNDFMKKQSESFDLKDEKTFVIFSFWI